MSDRGRKVGKARRGGKVARRGRRAPRRGRRGRGLRGRRRGVIARRAALTQRLISPHPPSQQTGQQQGTSANQR